MNLVERVNKHNHYLEILEYAECLGLITSLL